jgi:hypothetical protein
VGVSVRAFHPANQISIKEIEAQEGTAQSMYPKRIDRAVSGRLPRKEKRSDVGGGSAEA